MRSCRAPRARARGLSGGSARCACTTAGPTGTPRAPPTTACWRCRGCSSRSAAARAAARALARARRACPRAAPQLARPPPEQALRVARLERPAVERELVELLVREPAARAESPAPALQVCEELREPGAALRAGL